MSVDMGKNYIKKLDSGGGIKLMAAALIFAILVSVLLAVIVALVMLVFRMESNILHIAAPLIKAVSIFMGGWIAARSVRSKGWLRGGILGILYAALSLLIFGLVERIWPSGIELLLSTLQCVAAGCIGGMLAVSIPKKK